jgi:two-component system sensor histidine kinase TctE
VLGVVALADTYREAVQTSNIVSDRVLAGSALAIAERVVVAEDGSLQVDIPYVALEMLTSAAQDRVFYRVDGPPGAFITGYQALPVLKETQGDNAVFADDSFRNEPIRVATLRRSASTGIRSVPFTVTVAETTIARRQLARATSPLGAAALGDDRGRRSHRLDFRHRGAAPALQAARRHRRTQPRRPAPDRATCPERGQPLVDTVNSFMTRLEQAPSMRCATSPAMPATSCARRLTIIRTQLPLSCAPRRSLRYAPWQPKPVTLPSSMPSASWRNSC